MIRNYTTKEECKKLIELGLNPKTADMYYFLDPTPAGNIYHLSNILVDVGAKNVPEYKKGDIPCWSVGCLEDLIYKIPEANVLVTYSEECGYWMNFSLYDDTDEPIRYETNIYDSLIEMCVDMVSWLLKNKLIK